METTLNLLWVIVSFVSVGLWAFRWRAVWSVARSRVLAEAIALGCALVLLFPSISVTDDLHPEIVAVDAALGKRRISQLITHASHNEAAAAQWKSHLSFAVLPCLGTPCDLTVAAVVFSEPVASPLSYSSTLHGRSPPALQFS